MVRSGHRNMNLFELRAHNRQQFHPTQDWFVDESFMRTPAPSGLVRLANIITLDERPAALHRLPLAITMAQLYLMDPSSAMWLRYYWCRDVDHELQQVYVGDNGRGFEIHRHLNLTRRWAIALIEIG